MPGATELNMCHDNCQNKPPLRLPDDQVNNTFQNGGGNDLSNQVSFYGTLWYVEWWCDATKKVWDQIRNHEFC